MTEPDPTTRHRGWLSCWWENRRLRIRILEF